MTFWLTVAAVMVAIALLILASILMSLAGSWWRARTFTQPRPYRGQSAKQVEREYLEGLAEGPAEQSEGA